MLCKFCKKELLKNQIQFCSYDCSWKYRYYNNKKKCPKCNSLIGKYSKLCQTCNNRSKKNYKGGISLNLNYCIDCGKHINWKSTRCHSCDVGGKRGRFYGMHRKGKENPNWKGGTTSLNNIIRTSIDYSYWRKSVFERDNYICQLCGKVGGYLEVHHKIPFRKIIHEYNIKSWEGALLCPILWDINNGITYCKECHIKIDEYRR